MLSYVAAEVLRPEVRQKRLPHTLVVSELAALAGTVLWIHGAGSRSLVTRQTGNRQERERERGQHN